MQKAVKIILLTLIFINFLYVLSGAIHYPLVSMDVFSIWLLKAKEFYINGIFPLSNLNKFPYSHPQYPILLPLFVSFIYIFLGGVNEITVLTIYPFIYLAILFLTYKFFIKSKINETYSLLFTYIYSMFSWLLAAGGRMHAGEADIFLVLIYWGILHLAFNFYKDKQRVWGFWIAILIIVASQIKMEGVFPVVLFLFLPAKAKDKFVWILISIIPSLIWTLIRIKSGLIADIGFLIPSLSTLIGRFGSLLVLVLKEMANYRNWYIFWPLFWFTIFISKRNDKFFSKTINPFLISISFLFALNFLFSTLNVTNYASSSLDRIMFQVSPFFFIFFIINVTNLINIKSEIFLK